VCLLSGYTSSFESYISRLKPHITGSREMLLLIYLSFLLSAGQAIGIPQPFPSSGFAQDQNWSVLVQAPTPPRAVSRGFRNPLPFDEDIFDPTHVVSNPSRDHSQCTQPQSPQLEPLNLSLVVKRDHSRPLEIRRRSQLPRWDYATYFNRTYAEYTNPTPGCSEGQHHAPDRPLRPKPRPPVLRRG
jgi:hypothetical protein